MEAYFSGAVLRRLVPLAGVERKESRTISITSRNNPLLRRARAVRSGKVDGMIFVEGLRLCEEAIRSGLTIETLIYSEAISNNGRVGALIGALNSTDTRLVEIDQKLFPAIAATKTPQGITALVKRPRSEGLDLSLHSGLSLIVIMHALNNPVNVGAVLRSAEAAGATGVIATRNTADPFSPGSLRGAMGSAFRLPIWTDIAYERALEWCSQNDIRTVSADPAAESPYTLIDWNRPLALIVGPEASGLGPSEISATDEMCKIPMAGKVESLNVAVAAAIILYEAARQRDS